MNLDAVDLGGAADLGSRFVGHALPEVRRAQLAKTLASLIVRSGVLPRTLGYLGIAAGVLLILLYVAYLTILNALNPVVLFLILASGLCEPAWNLWLGWQLWRSAGRLPTTTATAKRAK